MTVKPKAAYKFISNSHLLLKAEYQKLVWKKIIELFWLIEGILKASIKTAQTNCVPLPQGGCTDWRGDMFNFLFAFKNNKAAK